MTLMAILQFSSEIYFRGGSPYSTYHIIKYHNMILLWTAYKDWPLNTKKEAQTFLGRKKNSRRSSAGQRILKLITRATVSLFYRYKRSERTEENWQLLSGLPLVQTIESIRSKETGKCLNFIVCSFWLFWCCRSAEPVKEEITKN
jgi:hypothetical protein